MRFIVTVAMLGCLASIGCDKSASDYKADAVRNATQAQGDAVRAGSQQAADDMREAAGKDAFGSAKSSSAEQKADEVEDRGAKVDRKSVV